MSFYEEAMAKNLVLMSSKQVLKLSKTKKLKGGNILVHKLGPFDPNDQVTLATIRKKSHKHHAGIKVEIGDLLYSPPRRKFVYVKDLNCYLLLCPGAMVGDKIHHSDECTKARHIVQVKPANMHERFRHPKCNEILGKKAKNPMAKLNELEGRLALAEAFGDLDLATKLRGEIKAEKETLGIEDIKLIKS